MDNKQFFNTLNDNIKKSTTNRALRNLEKVGENYVNNIIRNKDISNKIKKEVRKNWNNSKKLILKVKRHIKD
jgi:hypothetical protein